MLAKTSSALACLCSILLIFSACGEIGLDGPDTDIPGTALKSEKQRIVAPDMDPGDLGVLAEGNSTFALDLYHQMGAADDGDLFFSPYSISIALAMTWAGAREETEQQMASTLHFNLEQERLHPAFNYLDQELESRGEGAEGQDDEGFRLNVVNALWGQEDYDFLVEFLDVLALNYGAGLHLLDFKNLPDASRVIINDWVEEQTEGRIEDLIPQGSITPITRLVLTNAIYFNAAWAVAFEEEATFDGAFHLLNGNQVTVPLMHMQSGFRHSQGEGFEAVELPYDGDELAMLILVPDEGEFDAFEQELDAEGLAGIIASLHMGEVLLTLPRWTFKTPSIKMKQILCDMGMEIAFTFPSADFSGMDGRYNLYIGDVIHKAFVAVDEAGTEAAAATAVIMDFGTTSEDPNPPPVPITIDRPFIYLITDLQTGAILFMGRTLDPS